MKQQMNIHHIRPCRTGLDQIPESIEKGIGIIVLEMLVRAQPGISGTADRAARNNRARRVSRPIRAVRARAQDSDVL